MGKKYLVFLLVVLVTAMLIPSNLRAQTPGSEADVIKDAAAFFEDENYPAAMPLYSQLLANHPKDPNYNYRFGVCMLFANADKGKALPFLEVASKDPKAEVEVWFYLGRAYHLNYRFDEAIVAYKKFKVLAGEKKAEKLQVDNQIAMCKTGKKLLKAVTDITVLEKKELPVGDFFRSYNLEGYSGQLLVKGDEFKTNLDRKKKETSIIFLSGEKNILYFSSYGENEENGKDIYRVVRLPNGGWSKPYNVGYPINTEFDEDYPFLHPNGKVLYFSSKGHNSMGGYDIFRSELNEETGSWLKPENMDFAINSTDDDILFVTDFEEKTAWFASARNSPQGFMTVYHVVIERKPANMCIVSGKFKPSGVDPSATAKITVRNEETNQPVGVYKTNDQTGAYLINLPNTGGKYTFTVEKSGIHTQTKTVFIPPQYELKPIRQEIFYTESNGDQNLNVVTYFDEDSAAFAPDFLKEKANLDVDDGSSTYEVVDLGDPKQGNDPVTNNTLDSNDNTDTNDSVSDEDPSTNVPSSQEKVTNAELVKTAYENADETAKEAIQLDQQEDRAFAYAQKLNADAKEQQTAADKAKSDAAALPDGPDKIAATNKANELQAEANALQSQTVAAYNVAEALSVDAKQKQEEAALATDYAKSLDAASKSSDPNAMDAVAKKELALQNQSDVRPQGEENIKNIKEEADKKREQLQVAKSQAQDLREEKKSNEDLIANLQADAAKEKDPDLKAGYESQIEGIRETIADNDVEIKKADAKVNSLETAVNDLDNQLAAANATMAESKNASVAPVKINPDDKKLLSENVVAYQNRVDDSNTKIAPVNQTPVVKDPGTQDPVTENPVIKDPNTQDPVTQNPVTTDTQTQDPASQNTVVKDPNAQENNTQSGSDPVAQEPIKPASDAIIDVQNSVSEILQEADDIEDPVAKEQKIGNAHSQAEQTLDAKIEATQQQLAVEKDPAREKELQNNINQFREEKDKQHQLAEESKLREKQAVAATQPVEQPADPFAAYSEAITAADTISDPVVKESKKAETYTDWANALDAKVAEDKKLLAATKDKAQKDSLKSVIAADQKRSQELKQDAKLAKVAEQNSIAAQNSPGAKSDEIYENRVAAMGENPNVAERETAKEQLYTDWADSLRMEADNLDALAAKERNSSKKADLVVEANDLRKSEEEKRSLAAAAHDNAASAVIAQNTVKQNQNTNVTSDPSTNSIVEEGVKYNDTEAKSSLDERDKLNSEAKGLRADQDSLIAAAASKSGAEKNALLADASEAQRQAWDKEAEASSKQGDANNEQFKSNAADLSRYQTAAQGNNSANVEVAQLLTDEANTFLSRAEEKREEAKLAKSQYQRSESLREAEDLEQQALKKQQDALARYQDAGVQPSAVAVQNANVQTNSDQTNSNLDTNIPTANNQTTNNQATNNQNNNNQAANNQTTNQTSIQGGDNSAIVNPTTGEPYTLEQVAEIRKAPEYTNYVELEEEANGFDEEAISLKRQSEKYQQSANNNIEQAQDFALKAADESDPAKKKEYLAQSKGFNEDAKSDMGKRDSVNELVTNVEIEAKAKHNEADLYLNDLDKQTYEDVRTVGAADMNARSGNPVVNNQTPNNQTPDNQTQNIQTSNNQSANNQNTNNQTVNNQNTNTQTANNATTVIQTPSNQTSDPGNTSRVASQLKPGEEFKITAQPNSQPIPVDPPVPSGVVYKVQIGAFRNPIPVDLFKGIQPLTAESAGNGITRYTAGLFTEFANADAAKIEIRAMGYPDAFVVAFRDGKRISVADARKGGAVPVVQSQNPVNQNTNTQTTISQNTNSQTPNNQVVNTQPSNNANANSFEAPATDVKSVQGLFYTVQVGVYSRPVSAERLFNLTGLFSERTANGYIRYASGKYDNANAAIAAKNNIINIGIKDAFVTAYFEGERISMDRAAQLEREGVKPTGASTNQVSAGQPTNNQTPVSQTSVSQTPVTQSQVSQAPTNTAQSNPFPGVTSTKPNVPDSGLVFSVQLGAYREVIPVAMANRFLEFASRGVSIYKDSNTGSTVYQVGSLNTYVEASQLRAEALNKGITDAFIVAWKDGRKISVEEALKIRPQ